jgi:hypothetical protein
MQEILDDPRQSLLDKISLDKARVEFSESHIVLLCGGKVRFKERPEDEEPVRCSLRHAITHAPPNFETFRPEDITDWHVDGLFKNLMSFEQELAGICSLVVIALESEGSIAELGAFSQLPDLSQKIVAIKSRDFENDTNLASFINLGILRFLRENKDSAVRNYPWTIASPHTIEDEVVQDVLKDISEVLDEIPKTAVFNPSLTTHIAVLLCELVNIFVAVRETEFAAYLEFFDIKISRDDLRRKLFLLERFGLLKKEVYSDATFFMIGRYKFHRLRLSSKDATIRIDAARVNVECLEYYQADLKQRNRHRAISQAVKGIQR